MESLLASHEYAGSFFGSPVVDANTERTGKGQWKSLVGENLSHYQAISLLGQGGMGVVYKARDTHLDRFVAIKVLPPELVTDPDRKRRFVQEAKAASALNHPNIITIHDIASDSGIDFIVMAYVQGKALDQLIPRRGLRLKEVSTMVSRSPMRWQRRMRLGSSIGTSSPETSWSATEGGKLFKNQVLARRVS